MPAACAGRRGGIEPSVGSRSDSYDKALVESIIGLFKTEVIRRKGPWRRLEVIAVFHGRQKWPKQL
jgi:hypothetical protein